MVVQVGLTGGIGAGKTAVARRFVELGALLVDADALAREVVEPGTAGLAAVVAEFGAGVLGADGALDRPALGEDGLRRRRRAVPAERDRAPAGPPPRRRVDRRRARRTRWSSRTCRCWSRRAAAGRYDLVVVVEAPAEVRVGRLVRDRGMDAGEVRARMAAQASDAERRAVADVVLSNDGDLDALRAAVDRVWADHVAPLAARRGRPA